MMDEETKKLCKVNGWTEEEIKEQEDFDDKMRELYSEGGIKLVIYGKMGNLGRMRKRLEAMEASEIISKEDVVNLLECLGDLVKVRAYYTGL